MGAYPYLINISTTYAYAAPAKPDTIEYPGRSNTGGTSGASSIDFSTGVDMFLGQIYENEECPLNIYLERDPDPAAGRTSYQIRVVLSGKRVRVHCNGDKRKTTDSVVLWVVPGCVLRSPKVCPLTMRQLIGVQLFLDDNIKKIKLAALMFRNIMNCDEEELP